MAALAADFLSRFQEYWNYGGEVCQQTWERLLDSTTDDPLITWVFGTSLLIFLVYWGYALFFTFVDVYSKPKWFLKYKIQPEQNVPVDKKKLWKSVLQVLFNQLVVTTLTLYVSYLIMSRSWNVESIRQLPTMKSFIMKFGLMVVLEEPLFYYAHRMLHHRSIYKYFHKKHHEWTAPVAAMTFYCHPVEHVVSNVGPIALLISLLKGHILLGWLFAVLAVINSMTDHTGYYFPYFGKDSVLFHDLHHAKFNYNFGVFGWCDKFHGTYREDKKIGGGIEKNKKVGKKFKSKSKNN